MKDQHQIIDITKSTLPTLSSKAMFWRPKYLEESKSLEHIPFYFWLVEAQQTNLVFEPDLISGSAYFAVCQAVDKLNLDTLCMATFGKQSEVAERIEEYSFENYREFSHLLKDRTVEALQDFEDKTIDTLILNHSSELILNKELMERWQKKLSDEAIVLIHGSQRREIKPLCRKLKATYKTFEFIHGDGLLVVCYGSNQTTKIQSLVNHGPNGSVARLMQGIYSRLGSGCSEAWFNSVSKKKIHDLQVALELKNALGIENNELANKVNELSRNIEDNSAEKVLSLFQIQQIQEELEQVFNRDKKTQADNKELKNKNDSSQIELKKAKFETAAEKELSLLQIQQLQEELEQVFNRDKKTQADNKELKNKNDSSQTELKKAKSEAVAEKELSLLQIQQLQEELEQVFGHDKNSQVDLEKLNSKNIELINKNVELANKLSITQEQCKLEQSKNQKVNILDTSDLKIENELALLQIQQLQEELEHYFNKYQELSGSKAASVANDLSHSRFEPSLKLSKLLVN